MSLCSVSCLWVTGSDVDNTHDSSFNIFLLQHVFGPEKTLLPWQPSTASKNNLSFECPWILHFCRRYCLSQTDKLFYVFSHVGLKKDTIFKRL